MEAFVLCPICEGPMVSRANGKTGETFFGCKAYPKCRGTRNKDGEAPKPRGFNAFAVDDRFELPSDRARAADRGRWRQP